MQKQLGFNELMKRRYTHPSNHQALKASLLLLQYLHSKNCLQRSVFLLAANCGVCLSDFEVSHLEKYVMISHCNIVSQKI